MLLIWGTHRSMFLLCHNRSEKNQWALGLFCGTAMLYAARTVMPMCVVTVSEEMNWDKTEAVT